LRNWLSLSAILGVWISLQGQTTSATGDGSSVPEVDVHAIKKPTPYVFPLKGGLFTLLIPPNVSQRQRDVKPLYSEFDFYEATSPSPLFTLAEGNGSYDLKSFTKTCLNGRLAWRADDGDSGTVVMGQPGSWVAVSWSGLSGDRLSEARTIISSMSMNFGPGC
jgi:hypothetical protein